MFPSRLKQLRQILHHQGLGSFLVTKRENIFFLTGVNQTHPVNREAILLVSQDQALLYHSPFLNPPHYSWLATLPMSPANPIVQVYRQFVKAPVIGLESLSLTVAEKNKLQSALPRAKLIDTTNLIEDLRLIKDPAEIKSLTQARLITGKLMAWAIQQVSQLSSYQTTEISLSQAIQAEAYALGADGLAFPPVVAFGKNSASPHHQPTSQELNPNSVVLIDLGVIYQNYCSDMTRTIFFGTPPPHFTKIEKAVKSAHQAAFSLLSHHFQVSNLTQKDQKSTILNLKSNPITAAELDQITRTIITQAGYGDQFIHSTGHGLGLEVHEAPSLNSQNLDPLRPGMALTLEPGIYLPGKFGYRHEDTLLLQ